MRVLALSGSLRPESSNTSILRCLATLAPPGLEVVLYQGLADLPPFDPGLDLDPNQYQAPPAVMDLRNQLAGADALVICTPEYAFGMPGVLKNALDWTVSMAVLEGKPVAALAASPSPSGGDKALQGLLWVLDALGMNLVEGGAFTIPRVRTQLDEHGNLQGPALRNQLEGCLRALLRAVATRVNP